MAWDSKLRSTLTCSHRPCPQVFLLAAGVSSLAQSQFQTRFQDYDDSTTLGRGQAAVARGQTTQGRGQATRGGAPPRTSRPTEAPDRRETTTQVEILKQINE